MENCFTYNPGDALFEYDLRAVRGDCGMNGCCWPSNDFLGNNGDDTADRLDIGVNPLVVVMVQ